MTSQSNLSMASHRRISSVSAAIAAARLQPTNPGQTGYPCSVGKPRADPLGFAGKNVSTTRRRQQRLLRRSECGDPDCMDFDQLRDLQKSLDHFTDYDHYERCCDEGGRHHHHCSHGGILEDDECCAATTTERCSGEGNDSTIADCASCYADCGDCIREHANCYEEVDVCEDDCEQCEEECEEEGHEREDCPQNHPTTRDNCLDSCNIPLPLLGPTNDFDLHEYSNLIPALTPCTNDCNVLLQDVQSMPNSLTQQVFDIDMDHWQTFVQTHHCAPDPCTIGHVPTFAPPQHVDPAFGFGFGCDPSNPANRYPWQNQHPQCAIPTTPANSLMDMSVAIDSKASERSLSPPTSSATSLSSLSATAPVPTASQPSIPDRTCQWVMPCGSICGANFERTEDLKRHVKNSHGVKGTVSCGWKNCSAAFATEAALTGHISKKHLAFDEEGPWKCTFPNCTKSFMYKQVRDEHVASHNGGNKMHCPICHQWLNAEGSNFRRHMASHNPKHEHMKCKYEHLGCKKRFPRVDNLRRHETCCKFGKRAQGIHHHHHKVHVHSAEH